MGGGKYNVITYWYLISWVLNFVILARAVFRRVLLLGFHWANMKKGFKFRDSSILNLILVLNLLNFLKYRDEMKQAECI